MSRYVITVRRDGPDAGVVVPLAAPSVVHALADLLADRLREGVELPDMNLEVEMFGAVP